MERDIGMTKRNLRTLLLATALGVLSATFGAAKVCAKDNTVTGITKPSEKRELTITTRGRISELPVKEGDHVVAGQLLMAEDDRIERAEFERLQLQANSTVGIRAAQADLKVKTVALENIQKAFANNASNELELRRAEAEHEVAMLSVEKAKEDTAIQQKEADRQAAQLEMMKMFSPIDGIVAKLEIGVGEIVDPQRAVCTVVQNDPLWIEAHLPTREADRLKMGQGVEVRYPDGEKWESAEVIFFSPVANAAADTRLVRLRVANPSQRESGLQMLVKLPGIEGDPTAAAGR